MPEDDLTDFGTIKALLKRPELTQNIEWCLKQDLVSFPKFAENQSKQQIVDPF
jgi:hypothetical protein